MSLFSRIAQRASITESHVPPLMPTWAKQLGGYYMGVANTGDRYLFQFEKRPKADAFVRKAENAGFDAMVIERGSGKWAGVRVGVRIA